MSQSTPEKGVLTPFPLKSGDGDLYSHYNAVMTIEIFKTNVEGEAQANEVRLLLLQHFPCSRINFDLHDCDKVLRVAGVDIAPEKIIQLVTSKGVACNIIH